MTKKERTEPLVHVGIVSGTKIAFSLNGKYKCRETALAFEGEQAVEVDGIAMTWQGKRWTRIELEPIDSGASFSLWDVTIGVDFHWQRQETQTFRGALVLLVDGGKAWAVNVLPAELYLESVISSEMSATSSLELLKAHAVISRSWLLRRLWHEHTSHTLFDVCADDHCQRYQGITREVSPNAAKAVKLTRGQVLTFDGEICDTRYSKCCGGVMEEFQYCWEDTPKPYLQALADQPDEHHFPDLTVEKNAREWITSTPKAFCNTQDTNILRQVLNSYDQETVDFYRWRVSYTREELSALVAEKLDADLGEVKDLVPLERGKSGRIWRLKIAGSKRSIVIGKELAIRHALSPSHLYSSAFVVEKTADGFTLIGAGWGHGVGLCQIGAAVMAEEGYNYEEILEHYYPGAKTDILRDSQEDVSGKQSR